MRVEFVNYFPLEELISFDTLYKFKINDSNGIMKKILINYDNLAFAYTYYIIFNDSSIYFNGRDIKKTNFWQELEHEIMNNKFEKLSYLEKCFKKHFNKIKTHLPID